ncbi:MAG: hypothetical protein L0Z54_01930, partial [Thermoplasmata archaeon]|nr:hypothetical protein [Thermoplasmata archaeon]
AAESDPGTYPLYVMMQTKRSSMNDTLWNNLSIEVRAPVIEASPHDVWLLHNEAGLRQGNTTHLTVRIWNNGTAPIPWADIEVTSRYGDIGVVQAGWIDAGGSTDVDVRWSKIPGGYVNITVRVSGLFGEEYVVKQFYFIPREKPETFAIQASLILGLAVGLLLGLLLMIALAHFAGVELLPLFMGRRATGIVQVHRRRPPRQPVRTAPPRKRVKVSHSMDLSPAAVKSPKRVASAPMRWDDVSGEDEEEVAPDAGARTRPAPKVKRPVGQKGKPPSGKGNAPGGPTRSVERNVPKAER